MVLLSLCKYNNQPTTLLLYFSLLVYFKSKTKNMKRIILVTHNLISTYKAFPVFSCFIIYLCFCVPFSVDVDPRQYQPKTIPKKQKQVVVHPWLYTIRFFLFSSVLPLLIILSLILLHIKLQKAVPKRTSLSTSHKLKQHALILLLKYLNRKRDALEV